MSEEKLKPGKFLKTQLINQVGEQFKNYTNYFITECGPLSNKEMEDLRGRLKKASCSYMVVKNSLCKRALNEIGVQGLDEQIDGRCGIGFDSNDPIAISKVLVGYAKENEKFQLKGAYVDGATITVDTVKELASIPSREVLLARLVSAMNSPISGMVGVMSGIIRKFVYVINAIKELKSSKS